MLGMVKGVCRKRRGLESAVAGVTTRSSISFHSGRQLEKSGVFHLSPPVPN